MNYKLRKVLSILLSIMCIYTFFFFSIEVNAFNRTFYKQESIKLDLSKKMQVSDDELSKMSDTLLDYLKGYRDDIEVEVKYHKETRLAYTRNELKHMKDVRDLYDKVKGLAYLCIIFIIIIFLVLRYDNQKEYKSMLAESYLKVAVLFVFLITALSIYAFSDFNTFWNNFHGVFFSNDLWLLPSSSLMIQLLPETLFMDMVIRIIITFVSLFMIISLISGIYLKKLSVKISE